jgi:hypothetical protein
MTNKTPYKALTPAELLKPGREGRFDTFFDKIKAGEEFLLTTGKLVKLKKDADLETLARSAYNARDNKGLGAVRFTSTTGTVYKFSDFAKSAEFGGKGGGSGTVAEDAALADIKKKLAELLATEKTPYIKVKIGNEVVHMAEIVSTPGTPKSDFHVLDEKGNEVAWISHKKGRKANDFQQYGGMPEIGDETEVRKFADDVKKVLGGKRLPMKTAFARPVKAKSVIMKSLYGKEYKMGGASSRQNINVLYQGPMSFTKVGGSYKITSNHTVVHGEVPDGDYECYYYCRPAQDRTQFGVPGARFFIVAKLTAIKNRNTLII